MPGMSGSFGWLSAPTALTIARASITSVLPSGLVTVTDQRPVSSSNTADSTVVSNRQCSSIRYLCITRSK